MQQATNLNKKCDPGDQIPPSMLLVMLQLLVCDVDELSQVQTNAELNKVANGITIDYDTYTSLLLSAAELYDKKNHPTKSQSRRRTIYPHHTGHDYTIPDVHTPSAYKTLYEDLVTVGMEPHQLA
jgi:hypothetical protein